GGHFVLEDVDLRIESGEHVAIVGRSGAGKSTLVGVLLGWHDPAQGRALIDGRPLDPGSLEQLRSETAWVDPQVMLWNRSLLENLLYGHEDQADAVGAAISGADLAKTLSELSSGMATPLGEGGGLVSGGEGQRVRLGRALLQGSARLVVLDEPFRGLDREARGRLLAGARAHWRASTLLCVTHD